MMTDNTQEHPQVSILIPVFNRESYIEACIRSAMEQSHRDLEIVVVDNASTDRTWEICQLLAAEDDRIRIFRNERNEGPVENWRRCMQHACGNYAKLLFSDDTIAPEFLASTLPYMQDEQVGFVFTTTRIGTDAHEKEGGQLYYRSFEHTGVFPSSAFIEGSLTPGDRFPASPGCALFRLEDLRQGLRTSLPSCSISDFADHGAGPDILLYLLTANNYPRCAFVSEPLSFFRIHAGSITISDPSRHVPACHQAARDWFREQVWERRSGETPEQLPDAAGDAGHAATGTGNLADPLPWNTPVTDGECLVTAIVSTYNSAGFLRGCLDDLISQTISDELEIVVVDSGSEEKEGAIVAEYQKRFPRLRYIRTEQRETVYAAWNRAIRVASGKYLTNANTDDRHRRDALECMVEVLDERPDVALVYADSAVTQTPNGTFAGAQRVAHFRWPDFDPQLLFRVCYMGPHPMWRHDLHDRYGMFDAEMQVAGDYEFWLRMAPKEQFLHIDDVLGLYLIAPGGVEHRNAALGQQESLQARRRNWPQEWGDLPPAGGHFLVPVAAEQAQAGDRETEQAAAPEQPLVSVIMPTRDRPHLLRDALASLVAQTWTRWQLIIVNDGGASVEELARQADPEGRIQYLSLPDSIGQTRARNRAFQLVSGEIICFLDDDDIFLPGHLATVVAELEKNHESFVYTDSELVVETMEGGERKSVSRHPYYVHEEFSLNRLLVENYIPINTWAIRRHCIDEMGGFDEQLESLEDWEFLLRMATCYRLRHVPGVTVEVHTRRDQADNVSLNKRHTYLGIYRMVYERYVSGGDQWIDENRGKALAALERNEVAVRDDTALPATAKRKVSPDERYQKWIQQHALREADGQILAERMIHSWASRPSIQLIVVQTDANSAPLADTVDSLSSQFYKGWGLTIVSPGPSPEAIDGLDNVEWVQTDGEPMQAVNNVVQESGADWIALLERGDQLHPKMLFSCADYINANPHWRLIYTDEDMIDASGDRSAPQFKPDFNLDLLRSSPYIGQFCLIQRDVLQSLDGYSPVPGVAGYDAALKVLDYCGERAIGHIPDVLLHRGQRNVAAEDPGVVEQNGKIAVQDHLRRCGISSQVSDGYQPGTWRVTYEHEEQPLVSIIIPSRDHLELLEPCIDSLLEKTDYANYEVLLVDNQSADVETFEFYEQLKGKAAHRVRVLDFDGEFNFSAMNNLAAREARGSYLLLLNNDTQVVQSQWLERMVMHAQRPEVGIVGARLMHADNTVQHAGVVLGMGGAAEHVYIGQSIQATGHMGRAQIDQNYSAVTGACLLIRKSLYEQAGGLDAHDLAVSYSDVDLCIKVGEMGYKVVWTPYATLVHHGSASQRNGPVRAENVERFRRESDALLVKWLPRLGNDPAHNRNLSLHVSDVTPETGVQFNWDPEFHDRPRVLAFPLDAQGSGQYRLLEPLAAMEDASSIQTGLVPAFERVKQPRLPSVTELERMQPDVLYLQSTVRDAHIEAVTAYRKFSKALRVFELDDLKTCVPEQNSQRKILLPNMKKRLREIISRCDRMTVSTEPLAEAYRSLSDDIRVVPNRLSRRLWGHLHSARRQGRKPRVGWVGAEQHAGDLAMIVDAVKQTAAEVEWVFLGMCPDEIRSSVAEFHRPVPYAQYPAKMASLNLDLAIAPLEVHPFNEAKSNLRLLEYGMLGWPVVCTDIHPYRNGPVHHVNNTTAEWVEAIRARIHDLDACAREGDALRQWVLANWVLEDHLDEWLTAMLPENLLPAASDTVSQRRQFPQL